MARPAMRRDSQSVGSRKVFAGISVCATLLMLGACATNKPPPVERYTVEIPAGVTDARARFKEIFCAVLEEYGTSLPDYRPCKEALTPVVSEPAATGRPVDLGGSHRHLVAALVAGVGYSCIVRWLDPPATGVAQLRKHNYDFLSLEVDALSGIEINARQIRDAIMARPEESGPPRLVLIGYSKGAPDILEAVVRYPEIQSRVAAVLSAGGAVGGSVLANDAQQWQANLFRYWPGARCDEGDGGAVESLRPEVRQAWLERNPLPTEMPFYSLVTLPTPERVSQIVKPTYKKLGRIDWRNDSQLIYSEQIIPGSMLLGFINADHWALAVPVNRSHPTIASTFADKNDYPREAMLEAALRFIEEDLDKRRLR